MLSPEIIERVRQDPFARFMGFELLEAAPGRARVTAVVGQAAFNFTGRPHGGFLFSLADYAFAVASNAHGRVAVATGVATQFMATAERGERLIAEAVETHLTERAGFYEMTVRTEGGRLIARCLGVVHRTERPLLSADSASIPVGPSY